MFTAIRVLVGVACTFDPKLTWRQARAIQLKLGSPPRVRGFVMHYGRVAEWPRAERSLLRRDR